MITLELENKNLVGNKIANLNSTCMFIVKSVKPQTKPFRVSWYRLNLYKIAQNYIDQEPLFNSR